MRLEGDGGWWLRRVGFEGDVGMMERCEGSVEVSAVSRVGIETLGFGVVWEGWG